MQMNKTPVPVPPKEAAEIERNLLAWINTYDALVNKVDYEFLKPDEYSLAMSTVQTTRRRDILGGYRGTYSFRIISRLQAVSNDERLSADEYLNAMAEALENSVPPLGQNIQNARIEATGRAEIIGVFADGAEDHAVPLTLTYEVN